MKRRKWVMAGVILMITAGLLALTGCAGPETGWSIVGAWVNPEYVGSTTGSGPRVEYNSDDTFTAYEDLAGTTERATGTNEITEEWTEPGSLWLRTTLTVVGDSNSPYYALTRIFDNGNTLEGWMSTSEPDPETVERGGSDYSIHYREGA